MFIKNTKNYKILIPNRHQLLLLAYDIFFQSHHSYKSCETRLSREAKRQLFFIALILKN